MSAQPPSNPNPFDELKTGLQESPPLDEFKAGLADKQPLVQDARPRYAFGWFDKWLLAVPIVIGLIICYLLWSYLGGGMTAPTTATINAPAADAALQVGEPLTITGTAPPNSTVQIYNHGQLVAETTADADGNFMVRFVPVQAGAYELSAVATANGTTLESPPVQFVIAESAGQTPAPGQTAPANQTSIAVADASATSGAAAINGTTVPGTEGNTQGGTQAGTAVPSTEGGGAVPTTAAINAPAADAALQVGESLTISGTAPPNSTVQIYNQDQLVAETKADANGNFVASFVPAQAGAYDLKAVATAPDGTTVESAPMQYVIAESAGQTPETLPTTAAINAPAADATLQAGESLTISGTAPPNSTVQIYNQDQLVAETKADANGNFVVSFVPAQAGAYDLKAVATALDGTTVESAPTQYVIAESTGQTPTPGQTAPANQTSIAVADASATSGAAAANGTPVPGTEGGTQGGAQAGTAVPGTEGGAVAPTTATINAPAADAALQVGESLTISGTAPPNSTVQIYNQDQVVAKTTADANGNFAVSIVPTQAGAYDLKAVATTADGTTLESSAVQYVVAASSGQTPAPGQTPSANQTPVAVAGASATSLPAANGTSVPGTTSGTPGTAPTTAAINAPASDAALQAGESLTISGTAPPSSTVQIYNQDQVVAETTADANGNFVVSIVPTQAGAYDLKAVATAPDGTTVESFPMQYVIAERSVQTPAPGQTASVDQTSVAVANGTPAPGTGGNTQSGAQGATTPAAEGSNQGGAQAATTPAAEGSNQGGAQAATTPAANATQTTGTAGEEQVPPTVNILAGQWLVPGSTISGTGVPGAVVTTYLDDVAIGTATVNADGSWEFILPMSLESGNHILYVTVENAAAGASGATTESETRTESKQFTITIPAMTLPVTGGNWSKPRSCQWLRSACCWR